MIKISRQFKREIYMVFDSQGCDDLYTLFNQLHENQSYEMNIDFDLFIIKNKLNGKMSNSVFFELNNKVDGLEISYTDERVVWKMDKESLEISIGRFYECKEKRIFTPAEFMYVQIDGRKDFDYLYCKLI
ncbi:MAG: hypothetical protein Q4F95_04065 [Oscillospiraceae bacterium]|nr:hypothetical protein [Oscillospiraceae bacterium]